MCFLVRSELSSHITVKGFIVLINILYAGGGQPMFCAAEDSDLSDWIQFGELKWGLFCTINIASRPLLLLDPESI